MVIMEQSEFPLSLRKKPTKTKLKNKCLVPHSCKENYETVTLWNSKTIINEERVEQDGVLESLPTF